MFAFFHCSLVCSGMRGSVRIIRHARISDCSWTCEPYHRLFAHSCCKLGEQARAWLFCPATLAAVREDSIDVFTLFDSVCPLRTLRCQAALHCCKYRGYCLAGQAATRRTAGQPCAANWSLAVCSWHSIHSHAQTCKHIRAFPKKNAPTALA